LTAFADSAVNSGPTKTVMKL